MCQNIGCLRQIHLLEVGLSKIDQLKQIEANEAKADTEPSAAVLSAKNEGPQNKVLSSQSASTESIRKNFVKNSQLTQHTLKYIY